MFSSLPTLSFEPATGNVDYKDITQANFDSYCIIPAYRAALYQSKAAPLATTSSLPSHYLQVAMFCCDIKK
jgi:hypothetical protein